MKLKVDRDAFIGQWAEAMLLSYAGNGTASLTVRTQHTISGPQTSYAVYRNGKVWHESKDLPGAIDGWNALVKKEKLE